MDGLILFSVGSPQTKVNFNRSILNGFDITEVQKFIDKSILSDIQQDELYFWGCKSSKYYERKIQKVNQRDTIAFSMNKEFIIKGKIIGIVENKELSKFLWGDTQFSNILIVQDIKKISIPYSVMFSDIGYSPKAKINGLVLVDSKKLERLSNSHRNVDVYFQKYVV